MSERSRRWGHRAAGIEPSRTLLGTARKSHPHGDYRLGLAEELPFPDDAFDLIVSMRCSAASTTSAVRLPRLPAR
jgi:ubiquinone/menaquinone biosynthesis C-methylase UbiE